MTYFKHMYVCMYPCMYYKNIGCWPRAVRGNVLIDVKAEFSCGNKRQVTHFQSAVLKNLYHLTFCCRSVLRNEKSA